MTIATGLFKEVRWNKEGTWGTIANASGATVVPRTQSNLSLRKATYESASIRPDAQVQDFRHGVRSVAGSINGELQPKTFGAFLGSLLRGTWTAGVSKTNTNFGGTLSATASTKKLSVSASSWAAQGFKIGDVIRISSTAQNTGQNFRIVNLNAGDATVDPAPVDMSAQSTFTVAVVGKKVFTPQSGLVDESYTIEHWHSDISQSERFVGCKVANAQISLPATGLATVSFGFLGKDMQTGNSAYFTSPTANGDFGLTAAVNGAISINGANVANVTGLSISIDGGLQAAAAVGSNTTPGIFPGIIRVTGQAGVFFEDATVRDLFVNETIAQLSVMLTVGNAANADFISLFMGRVKFGGADKDDGTAGIVQTMPFQALLDTSGGSNQATDLTTLVIQDSQM